MFFPAIDIQLSENQSWNTNDVNPLWVTIDFLGWKVEIVPVIDIPFPAGYFGIVFGSYYIRKGLWGFKIWATIDFLGWKVEIATVIDIPFPAGSCFLSKQWPTIPETNRPTQKPRSISQFSEGFGFISKFASYQYTLIVWDCFLNILY